MEAQRVLARSLYEENIRAIEISKAYAGNQPKSFYVSWRGSKGVVDYTPEEIFDVSYHEVNYSMPGSDANGLVIGIGQRVGLGTLSKESGMEMDPLIGDVEKEKDRIVSEAIDSGILADFMQPDKETLWVKARVAQLVKSDDYELADAIMKAHEELQEKQSSTVQPAQPGSPEAMPGITAPGAPPGVEGGPPQDLQGMTQMLGALRLGQRSSGPEQAFAAQSTVA
jgi:hypothetical protein